MNTQGHKIYTPSQVREFDQRAVSDAGIDSYTLMERAGTRAFSETRRRYPRTSRWSVFCGAGNNGGDGYVVARLAREAGLTVEVYAVGDPSQLAGDARAAWEAYLASGGEVLAAADFGGETDLIVDALLGTGLDRPLGGEYASLVERLGLMNEPVVALDAPTGLNSLSGAIMGVALKASMTVTFGGLKQGFFCGAGPDLAGRLVMDDLGIPEAVIEDLRPVMQRYLPADRDALLQPRISDAHKGLYGHVLITGGNHGMGGAVSLAGQAALRAGSGLCSVATRDVHVPALNAARPEIMASGVADGEAWQRAAKRATVLAVGPGLGLDEWARELLGEAIRTDLPMVVDADALTLLAEAPARRDNWVLTPHPGEAARLLGISTAEVQSDRPAALAALTSRYGGVVMLKGQGSLVGDGKSVPWLIDRGNPGMATAGMGDVLTGICAGLLAQYPDSPFAAAGAAAFVHASAGDAASAGGQRGLLAGDLLDHLRPCLNP